MNNKPLILAIDDEQDMLRTYSMILKKKYAVSTLSSGKQAPEKIKKENPSLILLDIRMPDQNGFITLQNIKKIDKNIPVIIITASKDIKTAVEAIKSGAADFMVKPFEVEELYKVIENHLNTQLLKKENQLLKETLAENFDNYELLGHSMAIKKVKGLIDAAAKTDSTVLITGESGTGKELVAHSIHQKSNRNQRSFVAINCAAIPENLFESELFGHEKGSFTGAVDKKLGKFELAEGGTIFLDEIGCMPHGLQAKLLRALQSNEIERLGGGKPIPVNIRVIAATNAKIEKYIEKKIFREDLYYRLNVIPIFIPPLRQRSEDIPILANHFLAKFTQQMNKNIKSFTPDALNVMLEYSWPGNVRELQNLIERITVLLQSDSIGRHDLNINLDTRNKLSNSFKKACEEFEKEYILNVLEETKGNQTQAAKRLGVHRTTLISKISALGIKYQG